MLTIKDKVTIKHLSEIAAFSSRSTSLQLATIGAEIGRAISWRKNPAFGNPDTCIMRAVDYLYHAQNTPKISLGKRRELARLKEVLLDWYYCGNIYQTQDSDWDKYFLPFSITANNQ